jgi:hypothetical protein
MRESGKLDGHEAPYGTTFQVKKSRNYNQKSPEKQLSEKSLEDNTLLKNGKNNPPEITKDSVAKRTDKTTVDSSLSREKYSNEGPVVDASNDLETSRKIIGDRNKSQSENTAKDEKEVLSSSPDLYFHGR